MAEINSQYLLAQIFTVGNALIDFYLETNWGSVVFWLKIASTVFSIGLIFCIGWTLKRHRGVVMEMWRKSMGELFPGENVGMDLETRRFEHEEWTRVKKLWSSKSVNDKRLAIIDADSLLDNALREMNVPGDTMADRLSSPESPHLANLNEIAFAHKYRNELVHETGTVLDVLDAERAMKAYEAALKELKII